LREYDGRNTILSRRTYAFLVRKSRLLNFDHQLIKKISIIIIYFFFKCFFATIVKIQSKIGYLGHSQVITTIVTQHH